MRSALLPRWLGIVALGDRHPRVHARGVLRVPRRRRVDRDRQHRRVPRALAWRGRRGTAVPLERPSRVTRLWSSRCGLAAFIGAAVQSAAGIGFALVLGPALLAVLEPGEAVPALIVLGLALNALVLAGEGRERRIRRRDLRGLLIGARARGRLWGRPAAGRRRRRPARRRRRRRAGRGGRAGAPAPPRDRADRGGVGPGGRRAHGHADHRHLGQRAAAAALAAGPRRGAGRAARHAGRVAVRAQRARRRRGRGVRRPSPRPLARRRRRCCCRWSSPATRSGGGHSPRCTPACSGPPAWRWPPSPAR